MEITLATPALLFPALSLLLLAYTNRFVVLASLIRNLHERYKSSRTEVLFGQIQNLRRRMNLIRNMQVAGILSMLCCVISMFVVFAGQELIANITFGVSLVLLMISLTLSLVEIWMSVGALNLQLSDMEEADRAGGE